jgi:TPR repeat protein
MGRTSSDLYLDSIDEATSVVIKKALQAVDEMNHVKASQLLKPLVDEGNAAALYYAASFGFSDEGDEFEKRHIRQLEASAAKGFAPAVHALAICYDAGDMVDRDTKKAALLFKRAAEARHPYAQWIHGNDLLFGRNGIEHNEELGLKLIRESAEAKFEGALVSMVEIYENGSYGFPRDEAKAREWREKLNDPDVIGY